MGSLVSDKKIPGVIRLYLFNPFNGLTCYKIILDILIESTEEYKDGFLRIQPALEYMNLNFDKQISIGELSRILNLSQTYFRKLFKQAYDLSPIEYLNNIRINKAKRMLCHEIDSIGEISRKTGFCDIFYFSKTFKNKVGMSPRDFRKQTL
jgi:two-component system, response regulator YesN